MKTRLTLVLAVLAALGGTPAFAAPIPVQVKVQEAGDQVKLILDWKGKVEYKVHRAGATPAMVVELTPAKLAAGMQRFPIQKGLIGVIEATQADADTVKVRIPVMNPPVFTASSRGAQGGLQLLISTMDVDTSGRTTAAAPRPAAPRPAASASPAAPRPAASASPAAPRPAASASPAAPRPAASPAPRPPRSGVEEISALQNRPSSSAPAASPSPAPAAAPSPAAAPEVSPAPAVGSSAPPAAAPRVGSGPSVATPPSQPTSTPSAAASRPAPAPAPVAAAPPPAPRQAPAPPASVAAANIPSREYSLTLAGQDLRAVLTDLAKDMGLRPAIDPAVKGTVTTTIFNLDAASTVEAILRTQQPNTYLYRFTATELQVFPAGSAAAPAPAPAPAPAVATALPPPTVAVAPGDPSRIRDYFPIALPKKAAQLAEGLRVLCPGATVRVDGPMNVILVEASPADMDQVRRVLQAVGD